MTDPWDRALRSALSPARELEPTDAEVRQVLARDRSRTAQRRRRRPRYAVAACAILALGGGTYAVPATRAAVDDVYSLVSDWFAGGDAGSGPGRRVTAGDDVPAWVSATSGEKRLVAANEGAKLFVVRQDDGRLSVALGGSVGITDTVDGWRSHFGEHKLVVLGPGAFPSGPLDAHGRRPLFGLAARSVHRVELRYTSGAPTEQSDLRGGFIVLADTARQASSLVGYDASGRILESVDVSHLHLQVCRDVAGC